MTSGLGPPDWNVEVLARPLVVDADPTGLSGDTAATAAAAVAGHGEAVRALGRNGVVAVRSAGRAFEVHETLDGWILVDAELPTPDLGDLAAAARVRASRLAELRRARARTT